jgi:glucose-6-phosphate isomerase
MQLPDETISYQYQRLLVPPVEEWTAAAELRAQNFVSQNRLKELVPRLLQVRSQIAAERDLQQVPPELQPLEPGFIDLPQKMLDEHRRHGDTSVLGRVLAAAGRLREQIDRLVVVGIGGSHLGARALIHALRSTYHNELPVDTRLGAPRVYFAGTDVDNDALQDLIELLQTTCVDPELRDERWGLLIISKSGDTLETAIAHRILRREAAEYYGTRSDRLKQLFVPITGSTGKLRELCKALGYADSDIFGLPDNVGERYSVFTAAGLLPAAILGLDVRAVLLGAAAMSKLFVDEPFEHNPALQYAGVNYLMTEKIGKGTRVLAIWSRKLESVGFWYDHLLAESLGKQSRGPTPMTIVQTRDFHMRGQQHQEGPRDKIVNNLVLKSPRSVPIAVGMADNNQDELHALSRKTLSEITQAAHRGISQSHSEAARPGADLVLPTLSEHTMGQLLQMLMLATVLEGRLMGINPYGQPAVDSFNQNLKDLLKS